MNSNSQKPTLILIQSTDSPIEEHLIKGIWERQKFSLTQYAKEFNVHYYTCDAKSYRSIMPDGVKHYSAIIASRRFGFRHILYYFFLVLSSFLWIGKKKTVVRMIGVNVPVTAILKFISGKKFVVSYQFDWANGMKKDYDGIKPRVSGWVQSSVIGAADHLLCTTQWLADIAVQRYNKKIITIIPNYVNTAVFHPAPVKKKQIIFAGRLHWSKGIDVLLKAFKRFVAEHSGYELFIFGIGEELEILQKLGDDPAVHFMGGVSNNTIASYLNESEMFVLPTVNMEGHPKALVEAMAAGCKCIASDVPGNNNVLIDSHSEKLLFKSGDVDQLLEKLNLAITFPSGLQYEFALKNYPAEICFGRELQILNSLVS